MKKIAKRIVVMSMAGVLLVGASGTTQVYASLGANHVRAHKGAVEGKIRVRSKGGPQMQGQATGRTSTSWSNATCSVEARLYYGLNKTNYYCKAGSSHFFSSSGGSSEVKVTAKRQGTNIQGGRGKHHVNYAHGADFVKWEDDTVTGKPAPNAQLDK